MRTQDGDSEKFAFLLTWYWYHFHGYPDNYKTLSYACSETPLAGFEIAFFVRTLVPSQIVLYEESIIYGSNREFLYIRKCNYSFK